MARSIPRSTHLNYLEEVINRDVRRAPLGVEKEERHEQEESDQKRKSDATSKA